MGTRDGPRDFAHVGITVPDIGDAIEWYTSVLDWTVLKEPRTSRGGEGFGGKRAENLLGDYEELRVAHLLTGNGVGIEFFEFEDADDAGPSSPKAPGAFHICVVDHDVEELAAEIDRQGGDHYADVWQLYENDEEYTLTYCRDPFGNMIEIYSHSHERMHAVDDSA